MKTGTKIAVASVSTFLAGLGLGLFISYATEARSHARIGMKFRYANGRIVQNTWFEIWRYTNGDSGELLLKGHTLMGGHLGEEIIWEDISFPGHTAKLYIRAWQEHKSCIGFLDTEVHVDEEKEVTIVLRGTGCG